jgi:hypothetical protein
LRVARYENRGLEARNKSVHDRAQRHLDLITITLVTLNFLPDVLFGG